MPRHLIYGEPMSQVHTTEDERGVDVAQIRAQLRLTPAERVRRMTEIANQLLAIRARRRSAEDQGVG